MKYVGNITNTTDVVTKEFFQKDSRSRLATALNHSVETLQYLKQFYFKFNGDLVFTDKNTSIDLSQYIETNIPYYHTIKFTVNTQGVNGLQARVSNQIVYFNSWLTADNGTFPIKINISVKAFTKSFIDDPDPDADYNQNTYDLLEIGNIYINKTAGSPSVINKDDIYLAINGDAYYFTADDSNILASRQYVKDAVNAATIQSGSLSFDTVYPVGSTYLTFSSSFNPNTTWSGTTWVQLEEFVQLAQKNNADSISTLYMWQRTA